MCSLQTLTTEWYPSVSLHMCLPTLVYLITIDLCLGLPHFLAPFTELTPDNITVRVKKHASGQVRSKIVSFSALDKHFVLTLTPGSTILAPDFQATVIGENGQQTPFPVDVESFYTGYFNGVPEHGVNAVQMDEVWIAQIHDPDHWYVLQPRRLLDPHASALSMLVFENPGLEPFVSIDSTLTEGQTSPLHSFCQEVHFQDDPSPSTEEAAGKLEETLDSLAFSRNVSYSHLVLKHSRPAARSSARTFSDDPKMSGREKRGHHYMDTCSMLAIADYETFRSVGDKSVSRVVSLLVAAYQGADKIFRASKFGDLQGMGIQLTAIHVHTSYSTSETEIYNQEGNQMDGLKTLRSLTMDRHFSHFCLIHLTTHKTFGGTLGLAATADNAQNVWSNGICASTTSESRNIGLTTLISGRGYPLPISSYTLVLTHELGHNFGAHHDSSDDSRCSPSPDEGGVYIMWPFAGISWDPNSKHFSPCSLEEIGSVLAKKAHLCFEPRAIEGEACGDGILGAAEDCDVSFERRHNDQCCLPNCRLKPNAVCSAYNHPCCTTSCTVAPPSQTCHAHLTDQCYRPSHCTGTEFKSCPQPGPLPDNSSCQNGGRCSRGHCMSFCVWKGLEHNPPRQYAECTNDKDLTTMCQHSCKDLGAHGGCEIMGGAQDDGTPCLFGYCQQGQCKTGMSQDELTPEGLKLFSHDVGPPLSFLGAHFILASALVVFFGSCLTI